MTYPFKVFTFDYCQVDLRSILLPGPNVHIGAHRPGLTLGLAHGVPAVPEHGTWILLLKIFKMLRLWAQDLISGLAMA